MVYRISVQRIFVHGTSRIKIVYVSVTTNTVVNVCVGIIGIGLFIPT